MRYCSIALFTIRNLPSFCNVGQGDAVFIKTPGGKKILFDAGPDSAVLSCLDKALPFWQRSLDIVMLSHPHADHFRGLSDVLQRYRLTIFASENLTNNTDEYEALEEALADHHIKKKYLVAGDSFKSPDGVTVTVMGPTKRFLDETSPNRIVGEKQEFASLIVLVTYKDFSLLLTGDAQRRQVLDAARRTRTVDVLQVPHHGSATGLDRDIMRVLSPKAAVISVGKNSYGHPHRDILTLLQQIRLYRTDKNGTVVVASDGITWQVR